MKVFYSELSKKYEINESSFEKLSNQLPENFFLAYTIQFKKLANELKKRFGNRVSGFAQVLGCSIIKPQDTILLISEGKFHALNLLNYCKNIFVFDSQDFLHLGKEDAEKLEKENIVKFKNLLNSEKIGILVSLKYGQFDIKKAKEIEKRLMKLNKKSYIMYFETLNPGELENYNLDFFIVISCPGISYDFKNVINSENFLKLASNY